MANPSTPAPAIQMGEPFTATGLIKMEHDDMTSALQAFTNAPPGVTHALLIDGTVDQSSGPAFNGMFVERSTDGKLQVALEGGWNGQQGVVGKVVGAWYFGGPKPASTASAADLGVHAGSTGE